MVPSELLDLKMFMNYRRMRNIRRCNTFPVVNAIDVAQHSYYVAMLAMAFSDEYNTWAEEHNLEFHPLDDENQYVLLNTEVVLRKSLLHDTEESITSDIPWNIKHMNKDVHKLLEDAINQRIDKAYEGTRTMELYHKMGKECKDGFEGQVVDLADMTELAIYCYEELAMGNHYMKSMLDKCLRLIDNYTASTVILEASPLFISIREMLKTDPTVTAETILDID